jgi:hypothetical protein
MTKALRAPSSGAPGLTVPCRSPPPVPRVRPVLPRVRIGPAPTGPSRVPKRHRRLQQSMLAAVARSPLVRSGRELPAGEDARLSREQRASRPVSCIGCCSYSSEGAVSRGSSRTPETAGFIEEQRSVMCSRFVRSEREPGARGDACFPRADRDGAVRARDAAYPCRTARYRRMGGHCETLGWVEWPRPRCRRYRRGMVGGQCPRR